MSGVSEVRAPVEAASEPSLARRLVLRLSTDNPFYVLSALLVCLGLYTSFGSQARPELTWALMCGLAGYTVLLAVPACLLVRLGGVWEDVRTVLLLVVLMFLATSVTFDETLARDPALGLRCCGLGLAFAVGLSEAMLRAMRLKLPGWFRVAYLLAMALFYLYPAALVPLLDRPRSAELEWALYGFSPAAGLVALTLVPAARRGAWYVRDNGSPWPWPLYPWALFGLLGLAAVARSFLLCWSMQHVEKTDPELLIFGPYFLTPFLLAVAVVTLEAGLRGWNRPTLNAALGVAALAAALSGVGHRTDGLYLEFLGEFRARLGMTPLHLGLLATTAFYGYAGIRHVRGSVVGMVAGLGALTVLGPDSVGFDARSFTAPQAGPLAAAGVLVLAVGLTRRDPARCLGAVALFAAAAGAAAGVAAAFHVALGGVLLVGAATRGDLGWTLRTLGSVVALAAASAVATGQIHAPDAAARAYPPVMTAALLLYGWAVGHRPTYGAVGLLLAVWAGASGWSVYDGLRRQVVGLDAIALGLVLLAVAQGISAAKGGVLPRTLPKRRPSPREALE